MWFTRHLGLFALLIFAVGTHAQTPAPSLDLASVLDLAEYVIKPFKPTTEEKTGFLVGGKNTTALIRKLPSLNGRTIAALEVDMRPGGMSKSGFLGKEEGLLDVLAMDNKYVVEELGLTHQILAKHLHAMGSIGLWRIKHKLDKAEFVYHGRRYTVEMQFTRGTQPSPFKDGTSSGTNAIVRNRDNGKQLSYALLVPYMIERYGFYEGKGTPYRVDPKEVLEVFDFLKPKAKK
jgi:hypothetical protein